jgi:hypothetical protein
VSPDYPQDLEALQALRREEILKTHVDWNRYD